MKWGGVELLNSSLIMRLFLNHRITGRSSRYCVPVRSPSQVCGRPGLQFVLVRQPPSYKLAGGPGCRSHTHPLA